MDKKLYVASANRSGVISINMSGKMPKGDLLIAVSCEKIFDIIKGNCRLAYDNKTLLVPGIPEANNEQDALNALTKFCDRIKSRLERADA